MDSVSHGSHGSVLTRGGQRDEVSEHDVKQMKEDVEATAAKLGDGPVDVEKFVEGMEAHLAKTRTGPRAYLAQKSGYRALKAEQAVAAAELAEKKGAEDAKIGVSLERTKKLAEARQRKLGWDQNTPYYEKLIAEGQRSKQKLEQLAAEIEAEQMSKYTFQPETLKFKMPGGSTPRPRSARVSDAYSAGGTGFVGDLMRPRRKSAPARRGTRTWSGSSRRCWRWVRGEAAAAARRSCSRRWVPTGPSGRRRRRRGADCRSWSPPTRRRRRRRSERFVCEGYSQTSRANEEASRK